MASQPKSGSGFLIVEVTRQHTDAPQSVGLIWMGDQLVAKASAYTTQQTHEPNIHAFSGIRTCAISNEPTSRPQGSAHCGTVPTQPDSYYG